MIVTLKGHSLNTIVRAYPTLFYPQEWYRTEKFAGAAHWGEFDTAEPVPAAAHAMAYWLMWVGPGEVLYPADYVYTSDVDNEGNKVYVGRSAQFGGLQIHRLLEPQIEAA